MKNTIFPLIMDRLSDALVILNEQGQVEFANSAFLKLVDLKEESVLGRIFDFGMFHQNTIETSYDEKKVAELSFKFLKALAVSSQGTEVDIETQKSGNKKLETHAVWVELPDFTGLVATFHDASQLRNLERLKEEISEREKVSQLKDDFLSTVSHEIRTPLAIIKCAIENFRDGIAGPMNPKQERVIKIASANVDRLTRLIDDLLDLSKLESGKVELQYQKFSVNLLLEDTQRRFSIMAKEKNLTLKIPVANEKKELFLEADAGKITQVLDNLVSNALRYATQEIALFVTRDKGQIHIRVADDGPGLAPDKIPLLFNKFVQIDRPLGGAGYKGTGLGLVICREIIELHHGRIFAESKLGAGSTFHVLLPESQTQNKVDSIQSEERL